MSDEFEDDVDSVWPAVAGHADGRKDQPLAPTPVTCLHAAADQRQRAGRTACRIRPCGPLSLFAIASGAFASLLTRAMPDGIAMVLEDAARYRREQVFEPARFAKQVHPEALQQLQQLTLCSVTTPSSWLRSAVQY